MSNIISAKNIRDLNGEIGSIEANIDGKVWCVPLDENNRHYKEIQDWVADGNTIAEA